MTHIHYKFSSKLSYDTVVFDGPHITLLQLKKKIMCRERLRAADCDLQITNAQNKEEYTEDESPIPKGSSVIVRRIPISGTKSSTSSKIHHIDPSLAQFHPSFDGVKPMDRQTPSSTLHFFAKMANLADANVSEEDKIQVMINQSIYDSVNYNRKGNAVLPPNYTCYRCGNSGHHIRNCPQAGSKASEAPVRIKKSTGIPRSFMVEVDGPGIKGAMLTNCGRYAIPAIDAAAYAIGKKEKPPFAPQEKPKSEPEEDPVPDELLCLICRDLLSDAVVIPCCGNSYCDDCIRTTLLDSEEHTCPTCRQQNVSPDTLIANKFLRQAVNNYKKELGHRKSQTQGCSTSQSRNSTPAPSPAPTPPPLTAQPQPQKQQQTSNTQLLVGNPPSSASDTLRASPQAEQSSLDKPHQADDEKLTAADDDDSDDEGDGDPAAVATPDLGSDKDPSAAPSQSIPVVCDSVMTELDQSDQTPTSAGQPPGTPSCAGSSSSSSGFPAGGWTESQQLHSSPSSAFSPSAPPLFPPPLYHPYLAAHQSHSSYPPGYPPGFPPGYPPVFPPGFPPGFPPAPPIWTLPCPQAAPIPSLCSSTTTSPLPALVPKEWYRHQRTGKERSPHRDSTYRDSSSRSDSKSSKSKSSRSYSRSSSRSRSRSRSRGKSRQDSPHSAHHAPPSRSNPSYTYGYKRLRSPTPSSSSSPQVDYRSRSRSPSDHRKSHQHSHHHSRKSSSSGYSSSRREERSKREEEGRGSVSSSRDLEREHYRQWKKHYKEWCKKYLSGYVNQFHQLPFINLSPPQWEGGAHYPHVHSDPRSHSSSRKKGRSPPSRSSSDSCSPSSRSSSDRRSITSQSSSDGRSTPPQRSQHSRSTRSRSPCKDRSTPTKHKAELRKNQQKKNHSSPRTSVRGKGKENELHERAADDKTVVIRNFEEGTLIDQEQRETTKIEDSRKDESGHSTAARGTSAKFNQDKSVNRDCVRGRENESQRRGKNKEHDEHRGSVRNRKRREETVQERKPHQDESPNHSDKKKPKNQDKEERKSQPQRSGNIWEGGITVKPQKRISININLEGKGKEEHFEKYEIPSENPKTEVESNREDEAVPVTAKTEPDREEENQIKPEEGETKASWEKAAIGDDKVGTWTNVAGEEEHVVEKKKDREEEDFDLWHCALRGDDEKEEIKEQWEEGDVMKGGGGHGLAGDAEGTLTGDEEHDSEQDIGQRERKKPSEKGNSGNTAEELMGREETIRIEDVMMFKTESSRDERQKSNMDNDSTKDRNELSTVVETQDGADERGDQLTRVHRSRWDQEESEVDELNRGVVRAQESFPLTLPSVPPTDRETQSDHSRQRSVGTERDRERERDKEEIFRSVSPSGGKTAGASTGTDKGRWLRFDKCRGTDQESESERSRDRHGDKKRSKDEERKRDRDRGGDREHRSCRTSVHSSARSLSQSTSQDVERRGGQSRSDPVPGKSSHSLLSGQKLSGFDSSDRNATDTTVEVPGRYENKAHRDRASDSRDHRDSRDPTANRHEDRSSKTRHSSPSLLLSSDRQPVSFELSKSKMSRMSSPDVKSKKRDRDEEQWKRSKGDEMTKEKRRTRETEAETRAGSRWQNEEEKSSKWKRLELNGGERPSVSYSSSSRSSGSSSSRSSSGSVVNQDSSREEGRKEGEKMEKNEAALEGPEERPLKKHRHEKKK